LYMESSDAAGAAMGGNLVELANACFLVLASLPFAKKVNGHEIILTSKYKSAS
jgi:hypothetical protein